MAEMLVVKSKIKAYAKKKKMSFGGDAAGALSKEVASLVDKAIEGVKSKASNCNVKLINLIELMNPRRSLE